MVRELYHYGVRGMKWGIRKYQYADGSLTPLGRKRYAINRVPSKVKRIIDAGKLKINQLSDYAKTIITGKQYVDGQLKKGLTLSRIQSSKEFEKFAFYATYKKSDIDKYMGLFGKNLINRSKDATENLDQKAVDGNDGAKIYQLKLKTVNKLRIPSDDNASDITAKLLKEPDFRSNLIESIEDSKNKMKRPTQQIIFSRAKKALSKDVAKLSSRDKQAIYKAFNLSLTNHNEKEIAAQNRFYSELKKKGYNSLLDYNDKEYSSYHAKKPIIVFDIDSVKLSSVAETNPKIVDKLYKRYNTERIAKEAITNTIGLVSRYAGMTIGDCGDYVKSKMEKYLS